MRKILQHPSWQGIGVIGSIVGLLFAVLTVINYPSDDLKTLLSTETSTATATDTPTSTRTPTATRLATRTPGERLLDIRCGDIIESEFTETNEVHLFGIEARAGDYITVSGSPLGTNLEFWIGVYGPAGNEIKSSSGDFSDPSNTGSQNPVVDTGILSASGNYAIEVVPSNNNIGVYTLYISCGLRDGAVIKPGDVGNGYTPEFSGYGFPGLTSIDFSAGIEIPINLGFPQTAPIASDIAIYTFDANTGEIATLTVSRVSGDISVGVTVINRDTNEIIFVGGLPSSNNLTVELSFPSDDTYAIGLFRMDTPERENTSGAVEVQIDN